MIKLAQNLLLLNPKYFYLKEKVDTDNPISKENVFLEKLSILGNFDKNQFLYIPYGVSVATPSLNSAGKNLKDEDVYINLTVQNNINI